MTKHFIDANKVIIIDATNKELCNEIKDKIDTLKKAINICGPGGNKSRLIDAIDTLSIEINDRLLMKTGEEDA